jgi:hypothetical protein
MFQLGTPMPIPLSEAAKQVGITRVGLLKAIKKGRLSAEKNANGEWVIEPVELFRVYQPVKPVSETVTEPVTHSFTIENKGLRREIELQREQINLLREQLIDAKGREEKILKMMDEQIANIRVLTDQREKPAAEPEQTRKGWRGFLHRLAG